MRIGIVNDVPMVTEALRRAVVAAGHSVEWVAFDGFEAVARCARQTPDLVLMDLIMPGVSGVEATRRIMQKSPCAILIVTASVEGRTDLVYEALGEGAIDAIDTPSLKGPDSVRALLARITTIGKIIGERPRAEPAPPPARPPAQVPWLVALGASAGGPVALATVLKAFSPDTPAAVAAISHLDQSFAPGLAEWLGKQIALPVRLAEKGDSLQPGVVLIPGRDDHLVIEPGGTLAYTRIPVDYVYRPSIDSFFGSIVDHWPGRAVGVLLTGMGRDGARGLRRMREARFPTIAQDQATSAVYGMPKAAAQLDAAERILPLPEIGPALKRLLPTPR